MGISHGAIIPSKWTPLRTEIERVLADGAWHEVDILYWQVERFVDPRIAARAWARAYDRSTRIGGLEREPASAVLHEQQRHALKVGRRAVFWDALKPLIERKRVEADCWNGRRRVRLIGRPPE